MTRGDHPGDARAAGRDYTGVLTPSAVALGVVFWPRPAPDLYSASRLQHLDRLHDGERRILSQCPQHRVTLLGREHGEQPLVSCLPASLLQGNQLAHALHETA
jgi:hypothetical protein